MSEEKKANRKLRDNEAFCQFGACNTIIDTKDGADGEQGHCGMCCDEARALRAERVKPIYEAAVAKAEEEGQARAARRAAETKAAAPFVVNVNSVQE